LCKLGSECRGGGNKIGDYRRSANKKRVRGGIEDTNLETKFFIASFQGITFNDGVVDFLRFPSLRNWLIRGMAS